MELNAKPFILWILYYILGLDGFRIGNLDPSISSMQVDKSRLLRRRQYPYVSPIPVNNRLKRFFEFNPVVFSRKSSNKPEETFKNKFQFSPFKSSLQTFKENSGENDAYTSTKFKSSYINNGEKLNSIRPYVDHFSGVKSFTFHLKKPEKEKLKTTTNQHLHREKPPVNKLILQTFHKPKSEQSFKSEDLMALGSRPLNYESIENDFNNANLNGMSTHENNDWTVGNDDIIKNGDNSRSNISGSRNSFQSDTFNQDDFESLNNINMLQQDIQNYASFLPNTDTYFETVEPKLKKLPFHLPEYDSDFITDDQSILSLDKGQDSEETNDKNDFKHMLAQKQLKSNSEISHENLDSSDFVYNVAPIQNLDTDFNPFGDFIEPIGMHGDFSSNGHTYNAGSNEQFMNEVKMTNIQGNNRYNINNESLVDDGFGNFGMYEDKNENNFVPSNDKLSFVDINTDNSKPFFGDDASFRNDLIDPLEYGFGSFSYDDTDCDNIHTKLCQSSSECSCYGLYHCHENKCTSNIYSSDYGIGQSPDGHWHEEPVVLDTWEK